MLEKRIKIFLEKSNKIHNNFYDYSQLNYINARQNIIITCPIHGNFEQTPDNHSRGAGCPKCNGGVKITQEEFIKRAINKHGHKYDYSQLNYVNLTNKVKIICPIHGCFEQRAIEHLKYECRLCGINKISEKKKLTNQEFINKANLIHNNKYDYSKINYKGHKHKINILCPTHGLFIQLANSHLNGSGCIKCNESKGEKKIREFLINNNIKFVSQKKFNDCKYYDMLPFDFYLPVLNICIEYDGIQHEKISFFAKNENEFKILKIKDKIKTDYCNEKNGKPKLIRINYKDFDNINDILKNHILPLSLDFCNKIYNIKKNPDIR